ncbi:MAG: hypothetical protein Q8922_08115 [Bacteroidota bacterium]|nr:hypothetical protein [Bacteroidota bacterium]MDP4234188.1 hypothetical protein [Bacteroidota bacterium]MDP4243746.1 hypothetical protein [Bacteroidota bacterium]MDP4287889.1 hypothetical protein [Bacteroidota bacterium]
MRRLILGIFIVAVGIMAFGSGVRAQTLRITPDSSAPTSALQVSIAGVGTHFRPTVGLSMVAISLQRSGRPYVVTYPNSVPNDSLMQATLSISSSLAIGSYDLVVQRLDSTAYHWTEPNAFVIIPPPPKILSVTPGSAYSGQTVALTIKGQSTQFAGFAGQIVIQFKQNGTVKFTTHGDSILSLTQMTATLTIPDTLPAGTYDVAVTNPGFYYTGTALFHVLGAPPTVSIIPDTGAASTAFDVTIVGQGTSFQPSNMVSASMNIDLKQGGVTYYHTRADSVFSSILASAYFALSDSLAPGIYDAEVTGYDQSWNMYDMHTPFYVIPHPVIGFPQNRGGMPGTTVAVAMTATGMHFSYQGNQNVQSVHLTNGKTSIPAQSVTVTSDNALSATFLIPPAALPGLYNVTITEPGTNRIVTGTRAFFVEGIFTDPAGTVTPNQGQQGQTILLKYPPSKVLEIITNGIYLQRGGTIIPGSITGTDSASFQIPAGAPLGAYDVVTVNSWGSGELRDSIVIPHAFTITAAAGVDGLGPTNGLLSGLRVSPNPAPGNVKVSFGLNAPTRVHLVLSDALGRTVATLCDRTLGAGMQAFEWSTAALPAGATSTR